MKLKLSFTTGISCINSADDLVWSNFFDLKEPYGKGAKYTLKQLSEMSKQEYKSAVEEFYWHVYYRLFKDNYNNMTDTYSIEALSKLGLPPLADMGDIKSRFRELAKKHHPDLGGSKEEFIELYKTYDELTNQQ